MRGASTLVGLPCLVMTIVIFVGADLVAMIFGQERAGMAAPFRVLLAGQAFLFVAGHGSLVLLMAGRQRELMRSTLYLGAFYAALLPAAVYFWGVIGAAVAKSLATAERSAAAAIIVRKVLGIATTSAFSPTIVKDSINLLRRKATRAPDESVLAYSLES